MESRLLIIFTIFPLIVAQLQSTTTMDSTLQQCHNTNKDKEASLAASATDLSSKFTTAIASLNSIAKLKTQTQETVNLLNLMATVNNFAAYENMTTCADINQKITSIDMDVPKYANIITSASTNATYLQTACNLCNFQYLINKASVPSSIDYPSLITTCNRLVQEYLSYCQTLAISRSTIAGISANLKVYKNSYCICPTTLNSAGQRAASTIVNSTARIEMILLGDQSSVISAANDSKAKISTASSLVTTAAMVDAAAKIIVEITKALALKDFPSNSTNSTTISCADVQAQTAFARGRYNAYVSLYGTIGGNFATCNNLLARYNITYAANSRNYNDAQKTACIDVINAVTKLVSFYLKYYQDLAAAVSRSAVLLADVQRAGNSYCACNSSSSTTTVSTTASTTLATTASTTLATTASTTAATTVAASFCKQTLTVTISNAPYKNFCWVGTPKNYTTAYDDCQARGMMLFAIYNDTDYQVAKLVADNWFAGVPGLTFWVNGKLSGSTWSIFDPSQVALYSAAVPTVGSFGECLTVSNMFVTTQTAKWLCDQLLWGMCEFNSTSNLS